jgi:hypothetical protein
MSKVDKDYLLSLLEKIDKRNEEEQVDVSDQDYNPDEKVEESEDQENNSQTNNEMEIE